MAVDSSGNWIDPDASNPFTSLATIAGAGLEGIGAKTSPTTKSSNVSGFQTLPQQVQDFLMLTLFPSIQKVASTPYQGVALRPLNSSDTDPTFGSPARTAFALQMAKNGGIPVTAANSGAPTASSPAVPTAPNPTTDLAALAQQYLTQGKFVPSQLPNYVNQGVTSLPALGKALSALGYKGGVADPNLGTPLFRALGIGG